MSGSVIDRWVRWIEDIYKEVVFLSDYRNVFIELKLIIETNPDLHRPSAFYDMLSYWYATSAVMSVRRQVKVDNDSISLCRLLKELAESPTVITREYYVSLYNINETKDPHFQAFLTARANREFDEMWGTGATHINTDIVREHIDKLRGISRKVEKFADKTIAHTNIRKVNNIPTYDELDIAIESLQDEVKFCEIALLAKNVEFQVSHLNDWREIFKVQWIKETN